MRFTKKWMVVPFVEQQDENQMFSKLEKIIQSTSINDEEKINTYINQFKKKEPDSFYRPTSKSKKKIKKKKNKCRRICYTRIKI